MSTAVLVCALVAALGGAFAPLLIRSIPEPEPDPEPEAQAESPAGSSDGRDEADTVLVVEPEAEVEGTTGSVPEPEPEPKELYADIGSRRGLWLRTALVSAVAGGLLGHSLGWDPALVFLVPLVPVLVALAVVDWRTQLLPTWVIARTYAALVPLILVVGAVTGDWDDVLRSFWGWLVTGGIYFVLWFINSAGLGYGDVRLSGILGLALGHLGWAELFAGVYSAFVLGGVIGAVLAVLKVVDRKGVPFGPFMVAGALLGVLLGPWTGARLG